MGANQPGMGVGNAYSIVNGATGSAYVNGVVSPAAGGMTQVAKNTGEIFVGCLNAWNGISNNAVSFYFAGIQKFHLIASGLCDPVKIDFAMTNYFL